MTEKKLTKTTQTRGRQISLEKVEKIDVRARRGQLIGWEVDPPRRGASYEVLLREGSLLRTSPVQDIKEIEDVLVIQTYNSIYQIRELAEKIATKSNVLESQRERPRPQKTERLEMDWI